MRPPIPPSSARRFRHQFDRRPWGRILSVIGTASAVMAMAASFPDRAEAGELLLNGEGGGHYKMGVMTWWEIPFRSVVRQRYDFSCGSAAIATLLSYHYAMPVPERAAFAEMWKRGDQKMIRQVGFSMLDMKNYLNALGMKAEGFRLTIAELQQVKRPSIVMIDLKGYKHFVVIKGITQDKVVVGDSILGLTQYSLKDFEKMWNGIALAIIRTPDNRTAQFNLANDWGPWATAPLETGIDTLSIGDLTTHLPNKYQLTPQLLIDVRVGTVK
jgi:uncharacterized protein